MPDLTGVCKPARTSDDKEETKRRRASAPSLLENVEPDTPNFRPQRRRHSMPSLQQRVPLDAPTLTGPSFDHDYEILVGLRGREPHERRGRTSMVSSNANSRYRITYHDDLLNNDAYREYEGCLRQ